MDKYHRQIEFEEILFKGSIHKFHQAYKTKDHKNYNHSLGGSMLPKKGFTALIHAIDMKKEEYKRSNVGIRNDVKIFLNLLPSEVLAAITAGVVTSRMLTLKNEVPTIALQIVNALIDQYKLERVKSYAKENKDNVLAYKHLLRTLTGSSGSKSQTSISKTFRIITEKAGINNFGKGLDHGFKIRLGITLLDLYWRSTGLVEILERRVGKRTKKHVEPTEATLQWLKGADRHAIATSLINYPMIMKPLTWTPHQDGGYVGRLAVSANNRLVNTFHENYLSDYIEGYEGMPIVYDAINAVNGTPWVINKNIYEVIKYAWEESNDSTVFGLVPQQAEEIPERPEDYWTNEEVRKAYIKKIGIIYTHDHKRKSKRTTLMLQSKMCRELKKEEEIYFPHFFDTRGRMYSRVSFISPQGDDLSKSVIAFKDSVRYGEHGYKWLSIHLCNTFGENDKDKIEGRLKWVEDNHDNIMRSAYDPLENKWWVEADKKNRYQFLAGCFEYARYHDSGLKEDFKGNLPVAMDGSNNGLQHFAALLRDEVGGRAVNLINQEYPADVYTDIAVAVQRMIEEERNPEDLPSALLWNGKVTRKVTKKPVMTKPYNANIMTFKDQLLNFLLEYREEQGKGIITYLDTDRPMKAISYMANLIDKALREILIAANEAMDWFSVIASILATEDLGFIYKTPNGFPVSHTYKDYKQKRIRTILGGFKYVPASYVDTGGINTRKSKTALSPNFIHSMDAAHLQRTVVGAYKEGLRHFAMVHDSYGTHAGNAEILSRVLREQFVELYQEDHLELFKNQVENFLIDRGFTDKIDLIPELPSKGNLDIKEVLDSTFFFL